jgi:Flp pilus assembly protein TadD
MQSFFDKKDCIIFLTKQEKVYNDAEQLIHYRRKEMKRLLALVLVIFIIGCGSRTQAEGKEAASLVPQKKFLNDGIRNLQEGNALEAVKSFAEAIRQDPKDTRSYFLLGETYMHLKQYERATDIFLAASRVAPGEGQIYYLLAVNYALSGDLDLAQVNAKKSIVLFQQERDQKNLKKSLVLLQGLTTAQPDVASLSTTVK